LLQAVKKAVDAKTIANNLIVFISICFGEKRLQRLCCLIAYRLYNI